VPTGCASGKKRFPANVSPALWNLKLVFVPLSVLPVISPLSTFLLVVSIRVLRARSGCVARAAHDVERDVRLVSDNPAVVPRRHVEELPGLRHDLAPVGHRDDSLSREDDAYVLDLARALPSEAPTCSDHFQPGA